jgi:pimeloyl-ACP methyl ester carboxylesterase
VKDDTMNVSNDLLSEDFFIVAEGHNLRVRKLSHPHRASSVKHPVLVFLHEGLGCIELWRDFPSAIAQATGCDALMYDRWGHGKSDPLELPRPLNYVQNEALISLPQVLKICAVNDAVLVGHSDGGSIALLFAAEYPEAVCGIITEAAHVFVEEVTLEGIRQAVSTYETTNLKERLARYHGDNTELIFTGWHEAWLSPEFINWNIEQYLPGIRCPVLVIQGEDDEYGTESQVEAIATQVSGPSKSLLIPNCAHIPHQQARELVERAMTRFVLSLF